MPEPITIHTAGSNERDIVIVLLRSAKLPADDLPQELNNFLVARDDEKIVGTIGLEIYEKNGLLRSLMVEPAYRNKKVGAALIDRLELLGRKSGLYNIYLLTETAEKYFSGKGYTRIERAQAPSSLQKSSEFSHVCPASAVLMIKSI